MNINLKRNLMFTLLLLPTMASHAATVESEVSNMDTVVIGAASEKVTLRVTGYKNLKGTEATYGSVYASTTSALGQLALTFAPEHEPIIIRSGNEIVTYYRPQGKIKNADGDVYKVNLNGATYYNKEINGTAWAVAREGANTYIGTLQSPGSQTLKPGTYPVTIRAALYQQ